MQQSDKSYITFAEIQRDDIHEIKLILFSTGENPKNLHLNLLQTSQQAHLR